MDIFTAFKRLFAADAYIKIDELEEQLAVLESIEADRDKYIGLLKAETTLSHNLKGDLTMSQDKQALLEEDIKEIQTTLTDLKNEYKQSGNVAMDLYKDGEHILKWVNSKTYITPHFQVWEMQQGDELEYLKVDYNLFLAAEKIKTHFKGAKVSIKISKDINRGFRSYFCNLKAGGVEDSQHVPGKAMDISVEGYTPLTVYKWVKANHKDLGIGGLGVYRTFVHIDTRNNGKTLVSWDKR